jgi:hypothetical protein
MQCASYLNFCIEGIRFVLLIFLLSYLSGWKSFKKQAHCENKLSAIGFFDIDKSILVCILSTSVCYLIILVQFQMTFDSKKEKTIVTDGE